MAFYKFAKDMKYVALYWALGFEEIEENVFIKKYKSASITIYSEEQYALLDKRITIIGDNILRLDTHKSFVILECIDKLLMMGYQPSSIILDLDNEYDLYVDNLYIKCFEWGHLEIDPLNPKPGTYISISYTSRLTSGAIERITKIKDGVSCFDYGIFEYQRKKMKYDLYNKVNVATNNKDLIIDGDKLIKYIGHDKTVVVPEGIKELGPCAFWDNQTIEEVVLPKSLINLGGDTFYNCFNLKKIIIPKNVERMGNNPFAGCPLLTISNKSKQFKLVDGVLFDKNKERLIHYSINNQNIIYKIPKTIKIIGKHSFFLCKKLEKIIIPQSVIKMENNPFSGCDKLEIENYSDSYHIIDKVIYNKYKNSVVGCLNSIKTDRLELLPIKNICRNSFWNCKGIETIVLPSTLEQIGYNPFVGCSNIVFENHSNAYIVKDDVLYTSDMKKLVCYPAWKAIGEVTILDSVETLERGAFSGCNKMTKINLNKVKVISKTCFTNCDSLINVYIPDNVIYIGEWSFAHCPNMKTISISKETEIDNNAFLNNPATVNIR